MIDYEWRQRRKTNRQPSDTYVTSDGRMSREAKSWSFSSWEYLCLFENLNQLTLPSINPPPAWHGRRKFNLPVKSVSEVDSASVSWLHVSRIYTPASHTFPKHTHTQKFKDTGWERHMSLFSDVVPPFSCSVMTGCIGPRRRNDQIWDWRKWHMEFQNVQTLFQYFTI